MRTAAVAIAMLVGTGCHGGSPPTAPVYAVGGHLQDREGRTVVLRGVNLRADGLFDAYEGALPLPPFTADDCRVIGEDFGFDQVRLAINWSYLEPTRGDLDDAYLDGVLALAAACADEGVYSLVDLHEDGWSKYVGSDGAPFWAHQPPLPAADIDQHAGGQATTSPAVQTQLEGFFADQGGLVEDYASMAGRLAARIDQQPGVIGLELINEPLASPTGLADFYATVAPAVRAAAPSLPIYAEPDASRNVVDFAHPPIVPTDDVVYAPHLYTGVFQGNWVVGDDARIEQSIQGMVSEAAKIDAPLVVTEYGDNPIDPTGAAWLGAALGLLDKYAVSASFWVYEEWPSTCGQPACWGLYDEAPIAGATTYARTLRPQAVALLARAYPQAIAGSLDAFAYDATAHVLTVQMHGAHGTHVLAAPRLIYPGAVAVACDGVAVPATRTAGRVEVECDGSTMTLGPAD
jgi:endoglycosylceramidase